MDKSIFKVDGPLLVLNISRNYSSMHYHDLRFDGLQVRTSVPNSGQGCTQVEMCIHLLTFVFIYAKSLQSALLAEIHQNPFYHDKTHKITVFTGSLLGRNKKGDDNARLYY